MEGESGRWDKWQTVADGKISCCDNWLGNTAGLELGRSQMVPTGQTGQASSSHDLNGVPRGRKWQRFMRRYALTLQLSSLVGHERILSQPNLFRILPSCGTWTWTQHHSRPSSSCFVLLRPRDPHHALKYSPRKRCFMSPYLWSMIDWCCTNQSSSFPWLHYAHPAYIPSAS